MDEELFKAIGFSSGVAVWRELLGPEDFEIALREVPPATRALIAKPPLATEWISAEAAYGFAYAVARLFGPRGQKLLEQHGKTTVERDVRGIYRPMLRILTVDFAMARAGSLYEQYSRNAGRLSVERTGPTQVVCHYADVPRIDPVNAQYLGGPPLGVLSVVGVKNARVTNRAMLPRGIDVRIDWG